MWNEIGYLMNSIRIVCFCCKWIFEKDGKYSGKYYNFPPNWYVLKWNTYRILIIQIIWFYYLYIEDGLVLVAF